MSQLTREQLRELEIATLRFLRDAGGGLEATTLLNLFPIEANAMHVLEARQRLAELGFVTSKVTRPSKANHFTTTEKITITEEGRIELIDATLTGE